MISVASSDMFVYHHLHLFRVVTEPYRRDQRVPQISANDTQFVTLKRGHDRPGNSMNNYLHSRAVVCNYRAHGGLRRAANLSTVQLPLLQAKAE